MNYLVLMSTVLLTEFKPWDKSTQDTNAKISLKFVYNWFKACKISSNALSYLYWINIINSNICAVFLILIFPEH